MDKKALWDALEHRVRLLSEPIDFDQLARDGLLKKVGAWYEVPNIHLLPEHVTVQIVEVSSGPKGARVKFGRSARRLRARGASASRSKQG
jgi:hypothetical protein